MVVVVAAETFVDGAFGWLDVVVWRADDGPAFYFGGFGGGVVV